MTIPTLETHRLVLRAIAHGDLDGFAAMYADVEVVRHLGDGRPLTRAATWRTMALFAGHWTLRGYGQWALVEKATGRLVGRAGLWNPEGWPGLEVGWLVERSRWGCGFASEGGAASLAYAFEALGAQRVISVIEPPNAASIRVAEKLGERFCERRQLQGKQVSIYAISSAEWEARAQASAG